MRELTSVRVTRPTRLSAAVFLVKAALLKVHRGASDLASGVAAYRVGEAAFYPYVLAESRTPLWSEEGVAERCLQLGKVQNLRCALGRLRCAAIPAGALFSFWKQVGRATR